VGVWNTICAVFILSVFKKGIVRSQNALKGGKGPIFSKRSVRGIAKGGRMVKGLLLGSYTFLL